MLLRMDRRQNWDRRVWVLSLLQQLGIVVVLICLLWDYNLVARADSLPFSIVVVSLFIEDILKCFVVFLGGLELVL